jgi:hypothetical protein
VRPAWINASARKSSYFNSNSQFGSSNANAVSGGALAGMGALKKG